MCGTYSAGKYCGSCPRQPMPARLAFSIGFPPQTAPAWPGPTKKYRMGILVPLSRVYYIVPVQGRWEAHQNFISSKQNFFSKAFRHAIRSKARRALLCDEKLSELVLLFVCAFSPATSPILFCPSVPYVSRYSSCMHRVAASAFRYAAARTSSLSFSYPHHAAARRLPPCLADNEHSTSYM